ncbi:MAG: hypothetical protein RL885_27210 [Planctomycetota bacterium]
MRPLAPIFSGILLLAVACDRAEITQESVATDAIARGLGGDTRHGMAEGARRALYLAVRDLGHSEALPVVSLADGGHSSSQREEEDDPEVWLTGETPEWKALSRDDRIARLLASYELSGLHFADIELEAKEKGWDLEVPAEESSRLITDWR